jgi:hypothetical protein
MDIHVINLEEKAKLITELHKYKLLPSSMTINSNW